MSDNPEVLIALVAVWVAIGVTLSFVMSRRGHNGFAWLVLGAVLGPLAVVLAVDAGRHSENLEPQLVDAAPREHRSGPVDVLVGYDGSPQSMAAIEAVISLLGDRLGRLTVATVVPYGGVRELERTAESELRAIGRRTAGHKPELEVLHGRPSAALRQFAADSGFDLMVVGTRGAGLSETVLGSTASELARGSEVPVLIAGGARSELLESTSRDDAQGLAPAS